MRPEQEYLRQSIREWLSLLRRELGHYCASLIAQAQPTLGNVLESLERCYDEPTAFNISELNQQIKGFLATPDAQSDS